MQIKITAPSTLLSALAEHYPDTATRRLRSWVEHGRVAIDGFVVSRENTQVLPGQEVWVNTQWQPTSANVQLLFADKHLIVINKPAGLLSVASDFDDDNTAHEVLKRHCHPSRVLVVHRLDKGTSGVMLFAKTQEALEGLKELLKSHEIRREYITVVEGKMHPPSGSWQSYLVEDRSFHVHNRPDGRDGGELAITHYETIEYTGSRTWLRVHLQTGKKNQIRVHCAAAGHPVCGDEKYGATTNPIGRLALHAYRVRFVHPVTGKQMLFEAPLPSTFAAIRGKMAIL